MKSIFKYISLLIFSGLIIPFCSQFKGAEQVINCNGTQSVHRLAPIKNNKPLGFLIIKELAKNLTPVLKS
jgi:ABC-type oligopeptide transport system substrate-binding subunit